MRTLKTLKAIAAAALVFIGVAGGAQASTMTFFGVDYSLTYTIVDANTRNFLLEITGINGPSDTEGGRYGVNALAFSTPYGGNVQPTSVTPPTGFTYQTGGLNANGCSGAGNFLCFAAITTPTGPALAANSMLSFSFQLSTAPDAFPFGFTSGFKIDWVGENNNYDLISQPLTATLVPVPAAGLLLLGALGGLGFLARRRRKAA